MQAVLRISGLPVAALDASAVFHGEHLPRARAELAGEAQALALIFPLAPYDHAGWRKAAVADLAREATPKRVNGVTGDDAANLVDNDRIHEAELAYAGCEMFDLLARMFAHVTLVWCEACDLKVNDEQAFSAANRQRRLHSSCITYSDDSTSWAD